MHVELFLCLRILFVKFTIHSTHRKVFHHSSDALHISSTISSHRSPPSMPPRSMIGTCKFVRQELGVSGGSLDGPMKILWILTTLASSSPLTPDSDSSKAFALLWDHIRICFQ
ncbi:hypothetical protein LOK49_LG08G02714 [Camellia lanceoleosa]|uniref:Uncharacterized protein n=1 Tax=Camellia lanceoleosa TaxID=1840588 RepID=A0ACC0GX80_9ERIC|nr:hypothetical protein LOK49_LG08G02714 [Camellia lanceoleosa]